MFCHKIGLNYVSCRPFRVPIARLAAAQAALEEEEVGTRRAHTVGARGEPGWLAPRSFGEQRRTAPLRTFPPRGLSCYDAPLTTLRFPGRATWPAWSSTTAATPNGGSAFHIALASDEDATPGEHNSQTTAASYASCFPGIDPDAEQPNVTVEREPPGRSR